MARVALVPCNSYDEEKVFAAVQTGVNLMGGISAFVKPDSPQRNGSAEKCSE